MKKSDTSLRVKWSPAQVYNVDTPPATVGSYPITKSVTCQINRQAHVEPKYK